ncbi:MAG TPA: RluA family pseudouridine synthase [Pyrinomonadaceae bacterium]|nr:RluA family pseudouridine synthase [Pyrinomonadaceae bacterium]
MSSIIDHNSHLTISVTAESAGERLDSFLAARVEGWSRARLHRLIEDADVLINGETAKPSYRVRAADEIEIELTPAPSESFVPENIAIDVVYEDQDLIVINKPAGMVVHPAAGNPSGTLANALAFRFRELSTSGGVARPGIVHRLDKGTSGLMVVAKTEAAHEDLSNQFRAREVFKSYVALVHGQVEKRKGQIDQPIARDPRNRIRMAVVRAGRPALSMYKVREAFDRFTLLDVELKTGRTHQIRVHLASMKHPVVGDDVYGGGRDKTIADAEIKRSVAKLSRQFLHAAQLGFRQPTTHKSLKFISALPPDLESLLNLIKNRGADA